MSNLVHIRAAAVLAAGVAVCAGPMLANIHAEQPEKPAPEKLAAAEQPAKDQAADARAEETAAAYRAVWARFPADFKWAAFIDGESAAPKFRPQPNGSEPYAWPRFAELLEQNQPLILELIAVTGRPECRFPGWKPDDSFKDPQNLRQTVRVLRADAGRVWAAGDTDGCVDRVGAMYGVIAHCAAQDDAFYHLAGLSFLQFANAGVRAFTADPQRALTKEHAQKLLDALARVDGAGMDRMIATQRAIADHPAAQNGPISQEQKDKVIAGQRRDLADTRAMLEKLANP